MKKRLISMLTMAALLCSLLTIVPASAKAFVEEFDMNALPTIASKKLTDAQTDLTNAGITDYSLYSEEPNFTSVETKPGSVKITSNYGWDKGQTKRNSIAVQLGAADTAGALYSNKGTYVYEADLNMNIILGENTNNQYAYAVFGGNKGHAMDQFLPWVIFNPTSITVNNGNTGGTMLSNFPYNVNEIGSFTLQVKYHIRDAEANSRVSMYILEKDDNGNVVKTTTLIEEKAGWLPGEKTTAAIGGAEIGMRVPRTGSYVELTGLRLYKDDLGGDIADELAALPVAEHSGWGYDSTKGAITDGLYKYIGKIDYSNMIGGVFKTEPGAISIISASNSTAGDWLASYTNANPKYAGANMVLDHITNWGADGSVPYIYETDVKPANLLKEGVYPSLMNVNRYCALFVQYPIGTNEEMIKIFADGIADNRTNLKKEMDLTNVDNLKIITMFTPISGSTPAKMSVYTQIDDGDLTHAYTKDLKKADNNAFVGGATLGTVKVGHMNALYSADAGELPPSITIKGAKIYEMPVKDASKTDLGMDASDELAALPTSTVYELTNWTSWKSKDAELPYYYDVLKGLVDFSIDVRGKITTVPGAIKLTSGNADWGEANKNPKYNYADFKLGTVENWGGADSKPYIVETDFTINNLPTSGNFASLMDVNNNFSMYIEFQNGRLNEQMRFYSDGIKSNRYTDCRKYIDLSGEKNIKLYSIFTPDSTFDSARIDMYASVNGGDLMYLMGKTVTYDSNYATANLGNVKLGLVTASYDSSLQAAPYMEIKGVKMYEAPAENQFELNSLTYEKGENKLSVTGTFTKWRADEDFAPGCMIAALYDGDKLIATGYNAGNLSAFGYDVPVTANIDTTGIDVTGKKLKVFVWDSISVMNPYISGDSAVLTIE